MKIILLDITLRLVIISTLFFGAKAGLDSTNVLCYHNLCLEHVVI